MAQRDADRRHGPLEFIEGIDAADPQPTLYYLHALLPHEPYIYLRSGKQFTDSTELYGLSAVGRWMNDDWPVLQAYRRHLTQVRYVDALLGRLLDRLKAQRLYDRCLIVVTGDHGVSFRPGRPFKGIDGETLADIMSVPLFIKLPDQHDGRIDDRNAQTIDIVPTISDLLDADLSWQAAGHSLLGAAAGQSTKTIYHRGATAQVTIETARLAELRDAAVKRKNAIFGPFEPGSMTPRLEARPDLLGRRVSTLTVNDTSDVVVLLDDADRVRRFDPAAEVVPAFLIGQALDIDRHGVGATLAVAVNGTIVSTTKTYAPFGEWPPGTWTAMVDPAAFRTGRNDVDVFVVRDTREGVRLERAFGSGRFPEPLDLASRGAEEFYGIEQHGLLPREGDGPDARRWTTGDASITVPIDPSARPHSLRVRVVAAARAQSGRPYRSERVHCLRGSAAAAPMGAHAAVDWLPSRSGTASGDHRHP